MVVTLAVQERFDANLMPARVPWAWRSNMTALGEQNSRRGNHRWKILRRVLRHVGTKIHISKGKDTPVFKAADTDVAWKWLHGSPVHCTTADRVPHRRPNCANATAKKPARVGQWRIRTIIFVVDPWRLQEFSHVLENLNTKSTPCTTWSN